MYNFQWWNLEPPSVLLMGYDKQEIILTYYYLEEHSTSELAAAS